MSINRDDVERLSDLTCRIDEGKNFLDLPACRERIAAAVAQLHEALAEVDTVHGFGVYGAAQ